MPETSKGSRRQRRTRKDRVLQARIPEQLDDELRGRAEKLGLSVSTIVRNVLLNTFELVEGVVTDSTQIARVIQGHDAARELPETSAPTSVAAWQEAILNQNGVCEDCNTILAKGETAAIGVPSGPRPVFLCRQCLAALTTSPTKTSTGKRS